MRTQVTLVSHQAHSQQAILQLLVLLAQHEVNCKQLAMLTQLECPYLELVVIVPEQRSAWVAQVMEEGLDRTLAALAC